MLRRLIVASIGISLCICAADAVPVLPLPAVPPGPAAPPAAEAEWQKLETKPLPIGDLHQMLSAGLFDRELQHIVELPKDGTPVDTALPHDGKDKAGKDHPALKARINGSFIWVDLNADGRPDANEVRPITPDGLCGPFTAELHYEDGTNAPYTFWLKQAGENKFALIRGSGRTADFHGQKIVLLDDDGNGKYNDEGRDTVIIGEHPATFLGKHVLIDKELYDIQIYAAGTRLDLRPALKMETGTVEIFGAYTPPQKAENLVVHTVIVSGADGSFSFDDAHRTAKIPAGAYDLTFALFERTHEIVYLKKGEKTSFILAPGKTASPRWGGPVTAKFAMESDGQEVLVGAPSFQGVSGERYIPENFKLTPLSVSIAQIATDRMNIEHISIFGTHRYDSLPNGELKPVRFKALRFANDEYQAALEYPSGIMGKVLGKQRIQFVYKRKPPEKK